jgi:hypothetical protein
VEIEDFTVDWKVMRLTSVLAKPDGERVVSVPLEAVRAIRWGDQRMLGNWSRRDVEMAPASLL